jgi:Flp pilus assembly protein TadG
VTLSIHRRIRSAAMLRLTCGEDRGAQIVELALSLPLLMLFVVGIYDFSGALSLKQKLTNAARDGARVAAADVANDLGSAGVPVSVNNSFLVVDAYLTGEKINDCGLASATPGPPAGLTWTYTAAGSGCPATGITLTINRGCFTAQTLGTVTTDVIDTCVTIQYPYSWRFGGVSGLVGGSFIGPSTISTTATAFNEN